MPPESHYPYCSEEVRHGGSGTDHREGQVTIPKAVRDALGVKTGDTLVFRVEKDRAVVAASSDLLDLAGSVPAAKRATPWPEVRRQARRALDERR